MLHGPRTRRRSPLYILLACVILIGILLFLLSSPITAPSPKRLRQLQQAAANALSPPSLPFRKVSPKSASKIAAAGNVVVGKDRDDQQIQQQGSDILLDSPITPPVVHYYMNNVTTSADPVGNRENVLILTPLARFYREYWENLEKLSYPHELISLGFVIPKGREGNAATAKLEEQLKKTQNNPKKAFRSITILRQDSEPPVQSQIEAERHKMQNQKARRASMAAARNALLFSVLGPTTSWVLWMDGDVVETPPTIIQDLAAHEKPIIAANCMQRFYDKDQGKPGVRAYDFNNWVDSDAAQELGKTLGSDEILLEGYAEMATYRTLMAKVADFAQQGKGNRIMELDGVGGTALLVKAEVHRDGAMFPPFPFYHLIETEGFAKMARRLGFKSWGLPDYFVYHYNE